MEHLNTQNRREFRETIERLSPRMKNEITMEVYDEQVHVNSEVNCVLNTWSKEYETSFQGYNVDDFNSALYNFDYSTITTPLP